MKGGLRAAFLLVGIGRAPNATGAETTTGRQLPAGPSSFSVVRRGSTMVSLRSGPVEMMSMEVPTCSSRKLM